MLDYEGWAERERFQELDRILDRRAFSGQSSAFRAAALLPRNQRIICMAERGVPSYAIGHREGMTDSAVRQMLYKLRKRRAALDKAA